MIRKSHFLLLALPMIALLFAAGCKKKEQEDEQKWPTKTIKYDAKEKGKDKFALFSFEKGDFVTIDDPAKSKDWDIGFRSVYICTNGGTSTTVDAKGEVAITTISADDIETAKLPSGLTFVKDAMQKIMIMKPDHSGAEQVEVSLNSLLTAGIGFGHGANGPSYNPSNKIHIVKSATGKHYAFIFQNIGTGPKEFMYRRLD